MNILHLFWIVPLSFGLGFLTSCLLASATCMDCQEARRYELDVAKANEYEAGFTEGLAQLDKVG